MIKIYIDPGHGGDSVGAAYNGRAEQDDVLRLGLKIKELLHSQKDVCVLLSRETSINPKISARAAQANLWGADYFISLHRNAAASANSATGNEVWVYSEANVDTQYKASVILEKLCAADGLKNRGTHTGAPSYKDFGVNSLTKMASCLIETGFINNEKDNAVFDTGFEKIAEAIVCGLLEACGREYIPAFIAGDINKDGTVNSADARLAMRVAVGLETADSISPEGADMDGDGRVTSADARIILRKSVGLE